MPNSEVVKLRNDILISLLGSILLFAILFPYGYSTVVLDSIEAFNSTVTTLVGLMFTLLAVIYTFEEQFSQNRAVRILKKNNQFVDIIRRFFYAVSVLGVVWIYTFFFTIFPIHNTAGRATTLTIAFFGIWGFFAVVIRLWRCFDIFVKLNNVVRAHDE